jgi:hypothetical protein
MMGTELVPETSIFKQLTRLIAREDFINVSRRESFKSYIVLISLVCETTAIEIRTCISKLLVLK